jgi:Leucine-rich repeat (LRR) protein
MQLEELYIAYNDIDELFDIGFLEHLQVLDMEGNNVNSLDQLYYLRRLHHLQEVNFKHNPVTAESGYYQRIQDTVKNISVLDDEVVFPQFFEDKTKAAQRDLLKVAADKDREPSLAELTEEL